MVFGSINCIDVISDKHPASLSDSSVVKSSARGVSPGKSLGLSFLKIDAVDCVGLLGFGRRVSQVNRLALLIVWA